MKVKKLSLKEKEQKVKSLEAKRSSTGLSATEEDSYQKMKREVSIAKSKKRK